MLVSPLVAPDQQQSPPRLSGVRALGQPPHYECLVDGILRRIAHLGRGEQDGGLEGWPLVASV
jgi:hypothetical protein